MTEPDGIDPIDLDPDTHASELQFGEPYSGHVQNVMEYGVFVDLTPPSGSDLTGLMHKSELPPLCGLDDFSPADPVVVELIERKDGGQIALRGLYAPKAEGSAPRQPAQADGGATATDEPEPAPASGGLDTLFGDVEAPSTLAYPYDDAMRTLQWLRENDYEVTRNMIVHDDGKVTVHVTAEQPMDGMEPEL